MDEPVKPRRMRTLIDLLLCIIALMIAYAVRGWILASWLEGRYPWSALLVDVLALAGVMLVFRAFDFGVAWLMDRLIGSETRRRRLAAGTLRFAVVFIVTAPFVVTLSQLHPQRTLPTVHPRQLDLPCEDVTLLETGQALSAWHLPNDASDRPPVLILHGVGSNKQNFLPVGRMVHEWGHPVLLLDFRAHGESAGALTTLGYDEMADVKAAHDWLAARYPGRPIHVIAYSMGAAAAVRAASSYGIFDRLVLDSAFARVENSVRQATARFYFPGPTQSAWWHMMRGWCWLFTQADLDRLCPEEDIAQLGDRPILLIHGTEDSTTACTNSVRLHQCAKGPASLWLIEGAGHIQSLAHEEYASRLRGFFDSK